jgi:hypothetical protein
MMRRAVSIAIIAALVCAAAYAGNITGYESIGGVSFPGDGTIDASSMAHCKVYRSSSQSINNNTWTELPYNAEIDDDLGMHDNAVNPTRITIPSGQDGIYLINAQTWWVGNATGRRELIIGIDGGFGSPASLTWGDPPSTTWHALRITTVEELSAGSYVETQIYQNSGGPLSVDAGREYTWFSVTRIR